MRDWAKPSRPPKRKKGRPDIGRHSVWLAFVLAVIFEPQESVNDVVGVGVVAGNRSLWVNAGWHCPLPSSGARFGNVELDDHAVARAQEAVIDEIVIHVGLGDGACRIHAPKADNRPTGIGALKGAGARTGNLDHGESAIGRTQVSVISV